MRRSCGDTARANDTSRDYQPSPGAVYGFVGVALFVVGWLSVTNADENSAFGALGVRFLAGRPPSHEGS